MEYRVLPHGGEKISTIGLGIACLSGTREEIARIVSEAIDNGINYFDFCPTNRHIFEGYADAFEGRREKILMQTHFGAVYGGGSYAWSRDLEQIRETFSWKLDLFKTDYTDMGFIHCTTLCLFYIAAAYFVLGKNTYIIVYCFQNRKRKESV